ncbi:hypothetical protein HK105_207750 [Polyrhizophydium stewartii]|uniref:NADH:flavin oxidoreductase/NADH oxidase N-terminal domain-containing protein n=1 Tax=Polyrhizophydium stewartii TaxID=2732419 RepID=A0ABR4MZN4_9FUNG|nr:hypothetical protein HK105_005287 [Polyrhizophydium stewartii]
MHAFPAPEFVAVPPSFAVVAPADGAAATPLLFTPLKLRGVTLKNRIGFSPMSTFSAQDGFFNMFHATHLGKYALYGAGLIMTESTSVHEYGRTSNSCTGLWKDEHVAPLREIADFAHTQGAKLGVQLNHSGRRAGHYGYYYPASKRRAGAVVVPAEDGGWPEQIIAPSAVPATESEGAAREATLDEIAEVVAAFGHAARRANEAGVDVLELQGAHGFLIHQFLSPVTNQRTDAYGGSFENRVRFLVEVVREVRKFWPADKPLFVRLSVTDWVEGGWSSADTVQVVKALSELDVDLVDCSSGGIVPVGGVPQNKHTPGWIVPFSHDIKQGVAGMHTAVVGGITEAAHAESILQDGDADVVLLARELQRNPTWVWHAAEKLGVKLAPAAQYRAGFIPRK